MVATQHVFASMWGTPLCNCGKIEADGVHLSPTPSFSANERAGSIMGFRRTDVVAFDQPCELGFRCPVCLVSPILPDGNYDERLDWSEYRGFLWCAVCNRDYPSSLCVDVLAEPDPNRPWMNAGPDAAINMFLDQVAEQVANAVG